MKSKTKLIIIASIAAVIAVIVGVVIFITSSKKKDNEIIVDKSEAYRVVKVEENKGDTSLLRKGAGESLFVGMQLIPDDECTTKKDSSIALLVDSDKHILASSNTVFGINADGDEASGKVVITLKEGEGLFTIDNKLSDNDSFLVNTANAALSVRGTKFLVRYDKTVPYTFIEVYEGTVWVEALKEKLVLNAGDSVTIYNDKILVHVKADTYARLTDKFSDLQKLSDELTKYIDDNEISVTDASSIDTFDKRDKLLADYKSVIRDELSEEAAKELIERADELMTSLKTVKENCEKVVSSRVTEETYAELELELSKLKIAYNEVIGLIEDNNLNVTDESVLKAISDKESLDSDAESVSKKEMTQEYADELITRAKETISALEQAKLVCQSEIDAIAEAAKNAWRERYKEIVNDPGSFISQAQPDFALANVTNYSFGCWDFYGDDIPELVVYVYGSFSANGRYSPVFFISYTAERGAYVLVQETMEISGYYAMLDGVLGHFSVENGSGNWWVNRILIDEGSYSVGEIMASGDKNTVANWPVYSGASNVQQMKYLKASEVCSEIDNY